MPRREFVLSEYRGVWLFVLFDLPVKQRIQRKRYAQFRKRLLDAAFTQLQYSVYARYFPSEEAAAPLRCALRGRIPEQGHVRLLTITDRQFGKMESYFGKSELDVEKKPEQMLLF